LIVYNNIVLFKKAGIVLLINFVFFVIPNLGYLFAENNQIPSQISGQNLRKHVNILGSDSYYGRGTGQIGGIKAAEYLSEKFKEIGLKNANGFKGFYQNVPFHEINIQANTKLEIQTKSKNINPEINLEYIVHKSGNATLLPKPVEMVFVGFGIIAPEFDYNDYRNLNVVNKVVVMFSGEPYSDEKSYFYGQFNTKHSNIDIKQRTALSQGAKACIIIPNSAEYSLEYWSDLLNQYSFSELTLAYSPSDILTLIFSPQISEELFKNEKYSLDSLNKMFEGNKLKSFDMNSTMTFKGEYLDRSFQSPNIIGYIEGNDPELKDTYVIVSAHYDHLGIGPAISGDSIYNGVLDNAMGVAALLEIAKYLFENNLKTKRTIVFLLTTAEEKGLLGAIHYLNNPPFPLYKTVANINIDGLAFIDNFKSIIGIGSNLSDLDKFVNQIAEKMNLFVEKFPDVFKEIESFNRSDQVAFANVGIPALMLMDGNEYQNVNREYGIKILNKYMNSIYHTPFDDLDLLINYDAATQHANILFNLIYDIAQSEIEPEWEKWTQYYYEKIRLKNEKR
jgi:hypothetical protein